MREHEEDGDAGHVGQEHDKRQERMRLLLDKLSPHMADLLYQGSVMKKFPERARSPYVLKYRQRRSGSQDGRQRKIYIGPKELADELMAEIWRQREQAGTRYRHGHEPWYRERALTGLPEMPDQFSDILRQALRRFEEKEQKENEVGDDAAMVMKGLLDLLERTPKQG